MKDKVMFILAAGVMIAIGLAIVGDYIVAGIETQATGEPVEVSSDVMTLVQTALGGVIGIIGGYFGAKGTKKDDDQHPRQYQLMPILGSLASSVQKITGSFESIASATGTGSSGTITFSSIPSTYQHLQIRGIFRSDVGSQATNLSIQLNNTGGAPYARHLLEADGSATSVSANTAQTSMVVGYATAASQAANIVAPWIIDIHDYASSTKSKVIRNFGGYDANGSGYLFLSSGLQPATTAITRIDIVFLNGSNFTTATRVALYGIRGA